MHGMASGAIHQARTGCLFAIIWRSYQDQGKDNVTGTTARTDQDCPGVDESEEPNMAELLQGKDEQGKEMVG